MRGLSMYSLTITMLVLFSCDNQNKRVNEEVGEVLRFEKISYYRPNTEIPFKYRVEYYYDNGLSHRWIELDSLMKPLTDYIVEYDDNWVQTGARYFEPGEDEYAPELVRLENDSTRITEWIDSTGAVYYTMIDNLNKAGKTYRATFMADEVHGYDSTFYTEQDFVKRIFFTSVKGKVMNDRLFEYDSINEYGDWLIRRKIMNEEVVEIHHRETYYDEDYRSRDSKFAEGVISTGDWDENVISFTADGNTLFLTRNQDWMHQRGMISSKKNGVFQPLQPVPGLEDIYNGAISQDGSRIIYSTRQDEVEEIWLVSRSDDGSWKSPVNITESSGIEGGYFYWINGNELLFYVGSENGNIVKGRLEGTRLSIVDSLAPLNTSEATEFSPYMDNDGSFVLFTRYLEGDESQQGFFISYLDNSEYSSPTKLIQLNYGWSGRIQGDSFFYTDGSDIFSLPLNKTGIKTK